MYFTSTLHFYYVFCHNLTIRFRFCRNMDYNFLRIHLCNSQKNIMFLQLNVSLPVWIEQEAAGPLISCTEVLPPHI